MTTGWTIPSIDGKNLSLVITVGSPLFILGPNGSGKSALIQHAVTTMGSDNVRRITAHRQTWLQSGSIDMTPQSRRQFDEQLKVQEPNSRYRFSEWNPAGRLSSVLFDLTAADNDLARRISDRAYEKDHEGVETIVRNEQRVFERINKLLNLAGFAVTIENSAGEEILARHSYGNAPYSIAQMSDGERNAVIIAANALTVSEGTVLLVDEPERHLHRSIIEPFLSALFELRPDCAFIVSTHEIALPMASPESSVLMVRSCQWSGETARCWDAKLLEPGNDLPEDLKRALLGARKRMLFVEGTTQSLDYPLYSALFGDVTVIPVGTCEEVVRSAEGLRNTMALHDVSALGLIDKDNRGQEEIADLESQGIFALPCCSVESLYYCSPSMQAVANWQARALGEDPTDMFTNAQRNALRALEDEGVASRMAARYCEKALRKSVLSKMPDWQQIMRNPEESTAFCVNSTYLSEFDHFMGLFRDGDLEGIIARYPIRETQAFDQIARSFGLTRRNYERTVIARLADDPTLVRKLRDRLYPLCLALSIES